MAGESEKDYIKAAAQLINELRSFFSPVFEL